MHFYLKLANNNHIAILDLLLTEAMLVTTENPGRFRSGPTFGRIVPNLGSAETGTTTPEDMGGWKCTEIQHI